jgi:serine/threonine protein kinase
MGEVYLAKTGGLAGLEKHCVIKTLRPHFTADREYVTRFIDEARVVVGLSHRNICQVFDVGRVGPQYYLAMEFVPGRDLRTFHVGAQERDIAAGRDPGPLDEARALHIACEVLEALDYAHRAKDPVSGQPLRLIHRDVSPQNVMVNFEGEVKLIDFGLAASSTKEEHTQPHVVMGKMAYMAPEQARGHPIDSKVDLFAAAVVAYELLTGERYYEGMSMEQIWAVAGRGDYVAPRWHEIAEPVRIALQKALAATPEERHEACGDLREDLQTYMVSNGLRAGARDLRKDMHELFGDEQEQHQKLFQQFSDVTLQPAADQPMTASGKHASAPQDGVLYAATEESVSFIPSTPNQVAKGTFQYLPQTELQDGKGSVIITHGTESTGETARIMRVQQLKENKKRAFVVAASALAVIVVGVLLIAWVLRPAPPTEAVVSDSPEVVKVEPVEDPTPTPDPDPGTATPDPTPATADAGTTTPDPTPTPVVEETPKPKPTGRRRGRRGGSSRRGKLPDAAYKAPLRIPAQKILFLKKYCTERVACANKLVRKVKASADEIKRAADSGALDRCVSACKRQ